jgi:uncharacterized membrane protein
MTASRRPLLAAGLLLGAGLGGFFDGIVFHQLLQWHNMLSARLPPDNLVDAKINMFWDGVFHASVWALTVAGIVLMFRAGRRSDALWSGRLLAGATLLGWGLFNLVEGIVDHHLLQLHHVMDEAANPWPADLLFLAWGLAMLIAGWRLVARAAHDRQD